MDLNGCVGTFDAFVTRLRSDYSARQNAARRISATASLSLPWQTPGADSFRCRGGERKDEMGLDQQARSMMWRTPTDDSNRGGAQDPAKRSEGGHAINLQDQALVWSTPRASDAEKGGPNQSFGAGGIPLPAQAAQWGTPTTRDWKDTGGLENVPINGLLGRQAASWATPTINGNHNRKGLSESSGDGLSTMAVQWPTPTSLSFDGSHQPGNSRSMNATLDAASSLRDRMTSKDGDTPLNSGRSLNQRFVGWLMGWLDGWTSFECSETELSHFKQRMRSALWQLDLHDAPPAQNDLFG